MLVFLVDDDYEDHEIFKMAYDRVVPSYELVTCENGIEALDYFYKNAGFKPDLIFLDINMPRMNGKECAKELRKLPDLEHVPIILYSTHEGQKELEEALVAGANGFMTKPASISEFAVALKNVITTYFKSPA